MRLFLLSALTLGLTIVCVRADDGTTFWRRFARSGVKERDAERSSAQSETPEQAQARARLDWHRRVAVINKLREIGLRTSDQELLRQADKLDERAFEVYMKQTGRIVSTELEKQR
jgi:hypothetical protein